MSNLADLRSQVYASLGGRNDANAQMWADRGINAGLLAFALLTEPPECRVVGQVDALITGAAVNLGSTLTRLIRVERAYNSNGACPVLPIPFRMWDLYPFPSSGNVRYYSLHGYNMYYKPVPTATETLSVWYFRYPARLANASDTYPFQGGEDFVLSFAKRWAWACQEEMEDANIWSAIATDLALPEKVVADARKIMREEWGYESNLPKLMQQGNAAG